MKQALENSIIIDVETSKAPTLLPWQQGAFLVAVGIHNCITKENKIWVFNHKERSSENNDRIQIDEIQELINNSFRIGGHNLKFDLHWLRKLGIQFKHNRLFCTMVGEYLINGQQKLSYKLGDCCERRGIPTKTDTVSEYWDNGFETNEIPLDILLEYLDNDLNITSRLMEEQFKDIIKWKLGNVAAVQMELLRILQEIEWNGMKADPEVAQKYIVQLTQELKIIDDELRELFGFSINLNSNDELSAGLYGGTFKQQGTEWVIRELKYDSKYYERNCLIDVSVKGLGFQPSQETKKEGFYKTNKNILQVLKPKTKKQKRVIELLLERSLKAKALETFEGQDETKGLINKIQADGLIHPSYNQAVTKTGRLSGSDPNPQNLPRKGTSPIKEIIIPRNDWILNADLSQLEWRGCAYMCQDPTMLKEINNGVDIHAENAINFFGDLSYRTTAKIMTFRLIYGGIAYGFFMDQKMPNFTLSKWEEIVRVFYEKYPKLKKWQDKNIEKVYKNGYLQNPTGRIFRFEEVNHKDGSKGYSVRQIKNYPVQSISTADITPIVMIEIHKMMIKYNLRSLMIGQVHDSILFDAYHNEIDSLSKICLYVMHNVPKLMQKYFNINWNVPMGGEVELGKDYGHLMNIEDWRKEYGRERN